MADNNDKTKRSNDTKLEKFPVIKLPVNWSCNPERYFATGGLGGIVVGLMTGFFNPSRIPPPNTPLPRILSYKAHYRSQVVIAGSSVVWRVCKRTFVGSLMYSFLVCQKIAGGKNKDAGPGVVDCFCAGAISGAVFGFRGGPMGVIRGSATFAVLSGTYEFIRFVRRFDKN